MKIYGYIIVMAAVTYLLRALPLTLFRKKIENPFLCSFLYYVPYACLTALTIPDIFYATGYPAGGIAGFAVAVCQGYRGKSLFVTAASACLAVFLVETLMRML